MAFSHEVAMSFAQGHHLELSSIRTSTHIGAHADAPRHYEGGAATIEERSLDFYIGPCQVITPRAKLFNHRLVPDDIKRVEIKAPRVLFSTGTFPDPEQWRDDFCALSPELIDYLVSKKVKLVGIDTPSVDLANDKEMLSHKKIAEHDLAILEGLVLLGVPDGVYQLIALPLRLVGVESSPVRAILLPS